MAETCTRRAPADLAASATASAPDSLDGIEALRAALEQDADQIDGDVGVAQSHRNRLRVAQVGLNGIDLAYPAHGPQEAAKLGPAHGNADAVAAVGERTHHVAAQKSGAAKHGDERFEPGF